MSPTSIVLICPHHLLVGRAARAARASSTSPPLSVASAALAAFPLRSGANVGERHTAFVTTAGREFRLGGRPFYFQGTNFRELAFLTPHGEQEVYAWVAHLASRGLKVIRLFAATHRGEFDGVPMIESAGPEGAVYNEAGL